MHISHFSSIKYVYKPNIYAPTGVWTPADPGSRRFPIRPLPQSRPLCSPFSLLPSYVRTVIIFDHTLLYTHTLLLQYFGTCTASTVLRYLYCFYCTSVRILLSQYFGTYNPFTYFGTCIVPPPLSPPYASRTIPSPPPLLPPTYSTMLQQSPATMARWARWRRVNSVLFPQRNAKALRKKLIAQDYMEIELRVSHRHNLRRHLHHRRCCHDATMFLIL
jgi:hypothetical protein